jgi:hypothetical protein
LGQIAPGQENLITFYIKIELVYCMAFGFKVGLQGRQGKIGLAGVPLRWKKKSGFHDIQILSTHLMGFPLPMGTINFI